MLRNRPSLDETERLVAFLKEQRVATFEGHGVKLTFYQELEPRTNPIPQDDDEMMTQYRGI